MYLAIIIPEFIIGGKIFAAITNFPYWIGVLICSVSVFFYVFLGGFKSDVKTDFFQYLMILLLIVISVSLATKNPVMINIKELSSLGITNVVGLVLMGIFIIFVSADVWQRAYAAKNSKALTYGFTGAALTYLFIGFITTIIAIIFKANFSNTNPNDAMIVGFSHLPAGIIGIGLISILSAVMSTVDTSLFVAALFITKDITSQFVKQPITKTIRFTRITLILLTLVSAIIAIFVDNLVFVIYTMFNFALILAPAIIASFFIKLKKRAITISFALGIITAIVLLTFRQITADVTVIPMIISAITLFIAHNIFRT